MSHCRAVQGRGMLLLLLLLLLVMSTLPLLLL
jgi:hypothetical protein